MRQDKWFVCVSVCVTNKQNKRGRYSPTAACVTAPRSEEHKNKQQTLACSLASLCVCSWSVLDNEGEKPHQWPQTETDPGRPTEDPRPHIPMITACPALSEEEGAGGTKEAETTALPRQVLGWPASGNATLSQHVPRLGPRGPRTTSFKYWCIKSPVPNGWCEPET